MKFHIKIIILTEIVFLLPILLFGYLYLFLNFETQYIKLGLGRIVAFSLFFSILGFGAFLGRIVDDLRDDFSNEIKVTSLSSHFKRVFITVSFILFGCLIISLLSSYSAEKPKILFGILVNIFSIVGTFVIWIKLRKNSGLTIKDE